MSFGGGLLGISGGEGGLQFSGGGASTGPTSTGDIGASGGHTWNFAPPMYQVQAMQKQASGQQWASVAVVGGALVMAWLFTRK